MLYHVLWGSNLLSLTTRGSFGRPYPTDPTVPSSMPLAFFLIYNLQLQKPLGRIWSDKSRAHGRIQCGEGAS